METTSKQSIGLFCLMLGSGAIVWGLVKSEWIVFSAGLIVFAAVAALSRRKLVCPQCGYVMTTFGTTLGHCPKCGTSYASSS